MSRGRGIYLWPRARLRRRLELEAQPLKSRRIIGWSVWHAIFYFSFSSLYRQYFISLTLTSSLISKHNFFFFFFYFILFYNICIYFIFIFSWLQIKQKNIGWPRKRNLETRVITGIPNMLKFRWCFAHQFPFVQFCYLEFLFRDEIY